MHASRTHNDTSKAIYKATSAVTLSELGKLLVSFMLALREVHDSGKVPLVPTGDRQGLGIELESESPKILLESQDTQFHKARRRPQSLNASLADRTPEEKDAMVTPPTRWNATFGSHGKSSSVEAVPWASPRDQFPSFASPEKYPFSLNNTPERAVTLANLEDTIIVEKKEQLPLSSPTMDEMTWTYSGLLNTTRTQIFNWDSLKLIIPAAMFTGQSTLQHVALANLSVPAFQITAQLKILATALCSVLLLRRRLSFLQWISLTLLALGVSIIQLQLAKSPTSDDSAPLLPEPAIGRDSDDLQFTLPRMNQFIGFSAVLLMSMSSGFASTYFEKCLKSSSTAAETFHAKDVLPRHSPNFMATGESTDMSREVSLASTSSSSQPFLGPPLSINSTHTVMRSPKYEEPVGLWIRNVQLSSFALLIGILMFYLETNRHAFLSIGNRLGEWWYSSDPLASVSPFHFVDDLKPVKSLAGDFFSGFGIVAWIVVVLQVIGGLLAALVIKYADNIAKNFSTSLSILISFAASVFLFDFRLTPSFIVGAALVIGATWLFNSNLILKWKLEASYEMVPTSNFDSTPTMHTKMNGHH